MADPATDLHPQLPRGCPHPPRCPDAPSLDPSGGVRSEEADRRGGGGSKTPSSPECLERAAMSAGSHRPATDAPVRSFNPPSPSGRGRMIRCGSRDVPMNRIKASSARQRFGVRVACHRFRLPDTPTNHRQRRPLFRSRPKAAAPLCSAAAVQNLAENERFMGRGKPPDVVGGSAARPASSTPGNSPSASLRRCPPLPIAPAGPTH